MSLRDVEHLNLIVSSGSLIFTDGDACHDLLQIKDIQSSLIQSQVFVLITDKISADVVDCIRRAEAYPVRENCQEISLLSVLEHATSRQSLKQRLRQYEQAGNSTESFGTMLGKSSEMKDLFRLARIPQSGMMI